MIDSLKEEISALGEPQKQRIHSFFDTYLADFTNLLKRIDTLIVEDKTYSPTLQSYLNQATLDIVNKGHELEGVVSSKKLLNKIKATFRSIILPWMGQSIIIRRGLDKPRGYAGDYQMLEYIYDNKPISRGIGYYFDLGFLNSDLTSAVRNREALLLSLLSREVNNEGYKFLNLACGPCREIRDLLSESRHAHLEFTCIDFDEEALTYSKNLIAPPENIKVSFIKEDILRLIKGGGTSVVANSNIIYSVGLIDYLPDRILLNLLDECIFFMSPKSKLIISFKDRAKYNPIREDWLTDWHFVPRNEADSNRILKAFLHHNINYDLIRDPSGIIMFYVIQKR